MTKLIVNLLMRLKPKNNKFHDIYTIKKHNTYKEKKNNIHAQIILFGLNYSFRKIQKRKILLNLQFANKFTLPIPNGIIVRTFKRRLSLFGQESILKSLILGLRNLRQPNIYTGKGVRIKSFSYRTKPGKIRKR